MEPEPQPQEEGIPPELAVQQAQEQQWRQTRYGRWQHEQHSEPGALGLALLRLALASVMHPRLAEDAPEGVSWLPTDVVGAVGDQRGLLERMRLVVESETSSSRAHAEAGC